MRRNNKKIFIIILVLLISIGFAYLSTTLNISSLIGYTGNTFDIYFDRLREDTYKTDIVTEAAVDNKTTVNFSISLDQPASTYKLYADVYNGGTLDAMLDSWTLTNTLSEDEAKAIDISVSYADGTQLRQYDLLKAKLHEYVLVNVVYKDTISNDELLSSAGSLTCSLTMNYIQADEDLQKERNLQTITYIKNLNTEGTSISTTDHDGELRFIGADPNNYVTFNGNQTWRIIGVFDGKLKLIQDSIGTLSWSTSSKDVNSGSGINQWGESTYENGDPYYGSDLMRLLNPGYDNYEGDLCTGTASANSNDIYVCKNGNVSDYTTGLVNNSLYWNAQSGNCYKGGDYSYVSCDFTSNGLKDTLSRNMIDDNLWYLGSLDSVGENLYDGRITIDNMYRWERSDVSGKQCSNEYNTCTDTVVRTTRWVGKVGLIYPSDWAYATGGGTIGRNTCLSYSMGHVDVSGVNNWANNYQSCFQDDWLSVINSSFFWTINPRSSSTVSRTSFAIDNGKAIRGVSNLNSAIIRPTVYLKSNVTIASGDGSSGSPFVLSN
ncbi:MAG: hypothetical protein Q4E69_06230 [Bacilli bacterium]|nr:hypothetical protein [Bacilli bacterium]